MDEDNLLGISLLAEFDDLVRNGNVLNQGCEKEFLKYTRNSDVLRTRCEEAEKEVQRLHVELEKVSHENNGLETKLHQARMLFDNEHQARRRAETERDKLSSQLQLLRQLILEGDGVDEGTLRKVKNFESCVVNNDGLEEGFYGNILSPGLMREAANCRRKSSNLTDASVLDVDDLSFDETINLCESRSRARKRSRSRDPSGDRKTQRRRSSVRINDKVDILEITPRSPSKASRNSPSKASRPTPCVAEPTSTEPIFPEPNVRSVSPDIEIVPSKTKPSKHDFEEKTELRANTCQVCRKRIKFGKIYWKCSQCKMIMHPDCTAPDSCTSSVSSIIPSSPSKTKVSNLPNPSVYLTRTPSKRENRQIFASPMLQ